MSSARGRAAALCRTSKHLQRTPPHETGQGVQNVETRNRIGQIVSRKEIKVLAGIDRRRLSTEFGDFASHSGGAGRIRMALKKALQRFEG
jgi:hypothetical protein